jgi:hypothetical protein
MLQLHHSMNACPSDQTSVARYTGGRKGCNTERNTRQPFDQVVIHQAQTGMKDDEQEAWAGPCLNRAEGRPAAPFAAVAPKHQLPATQEVTAAQSVTTRESHFFERSTCSAGSRPEHSPGMRCLLAPGCCPSCTALGAPISGCRLAGALAQFCPAPCFAGSRCIRRFIGRNVCSALTARGCWLAGEWRAAGWRVRAASCRAGRLPGLPSLIITKEDVDL